MEWSIRQVARAAGTTTRTLRYYGEVGLLAPSRIGRNGYRFCNEDALVRLRSLVEVAQRAGQAAASADADPGRARFRRGDAGGQGTGHQVCRPVTARPRPAWTDQAILGLRVTVELAISALPEHPPTPALRSGGNSGTSFRSLSYRPVAIRRLGESARMNQRKEQPCDKSGSRSGLNLAKPCRPTRQPSAAR